MNADSLGRQKISFVLHKFDRGGSLRVVAYLARGFTDAGMDVDLIAFSSQGDVEVIILELMGRDIPVHYLGSWSGPRPLDLIRGLPRLVRALRERRPDTIVAAANNVAVISAIGRRLAGLSATRLFLKTTNPIASSRHKGIIKLVRRWAYRKIFPGTTLVLTLSEPESSEMRAAFPEFAPLFRAVANPYVTAAMLDAPNKALGSQVDSFILGVGRLTSQKRFDRLIKAVPLLQDRTVKLKILGEGEQRAELTELISSLGIEDRVSLPGYVSSIADEYHAAALFVLTSDYEGLPAVVLEAMAANCPVLATDCFPAARAVIEGAEGSAIIERNDPASIAALIDAHLAQPRPTQLRAIAETYSIANGVTSHASAMSLPWPAAELEPAQR